MISLFDCGYTLFTITDILGLFVCAFLLKKFTKCFPNKLIPIVSVVLSIFTSLIYVIHNGNKGIEFPNYFFLLAGIINGLAAVGLHQVGKQTMTYFSLRKQMKNFNKDKRKIVS